MAKKTSDTVKVRFKKSPTGSPFFLAYSAGQECELAAPQAALLIEAGIAVAVDAESQAAAELAAKEAEEAAAKAAAEGSTAQNPG
jgi:hypothetical protein